MKNHKKRERIEGYVNLTERYLEDDFKSHFRMCRTTVERLINLIGSRMTKNVVGRLQKSVQLYCLVTLWALANQESYRLVYIDILQFLLLSLDFRSIADRFDITKSTVFHFLITFCQCINDEATNLIKWPEGQEALQIIQHFKV